ncbi:MAG: hypothetical protein VR68_06880 [Peptococcaceae bacterium BRH_c4a]|nr:MAG: hypothetical protein VR68_06880 [Peptococcaceae bacterium BRH_c4a]
MDFESIQLEKDGAVAVVFLNRPESRNALNKELRAELRNVMADLAKDDDVRAVVITGRGKAFCAGGDLRAMGNLKPGQGNKLVRNGCELVHIIRGMQKPVIAAVNGNAFGAGWSIALACDFVVAAEGSMFSQAFVKVGLIPDNGSMYLLPRVIGLPKAKLLMMTGSAISAGEAHALGLVNKVAPPGELLPAAMEMAQELARGPSLALGYMKTILNQTYEKDFQTILDAEAWAQDICLQTEDHREGARAFFEKRTPGFTGK